MENENRRDLIDRKTLTYEVSGLTMTITGLRAGRGILNKFMTEYRKSVLQIIDEQPTVDAVELVDGQWEPHPYHPGFVRCSKCKDRIIREDIVEEEPFCAKCGTRLTGGDGNECDKE